MRKDKRGSGKPHPKNLKDKEADKRPAGRFNPNHPSQTFAHGKVAAASAERSTSSARGPKREELPAGRIVMGQHAILEAIQTSPKACRELWLREGWESSQDLKKIQSELRGQGTNVVVKPEAGLDRFGSHQGAILFVASTPKLEWASVLQANQASVLLLDGIEDPHNLGAIMRTSWLMGVKGILIPEDRAVGLTPTVHKVACGGVEHVPVEKSVNFTNSTEEMKKQGYWIFGLSHKGKKSIFDLKIPDKVVWCIGSEDRGLRSTTERLCDELISIPQASAAASYNASVATAMALSETLRQQRFQK